MLPKVFPCQTELTNDDGTRLWLTLALCHCLCFYSKWRHIKMSPQCLKLKGTLRILTCWLHVLGYMLAAPRGPSPCSSTMRELSPCLNTQCIIMLALLCPMNPPPTTPAPPTSATLKPLFLCRKFSCSGGPTVNNSKTSLLFLFYSRIYFHFAV
jgi:hypothetical protein